MRGFGQHVKEHFFKSNKRQAAEGIRNKEKNARSAEKTSLCLSEDDESNSSIPCALALRKYVDKSA